MFKNTVTFSILQKYFILKNVQMDKKLFFSKEEKDFICIKKKWLFDCLYIKVNKTTAKYKFRNNICNLT